MDPAFAVELTEWDPEKPDPSGAEVTLKDGAGWFVVFETGSGVADALVSFLASPQLRSKQIKRTDKNDINFIELIF